MVSRSPTRFWLRFCEPIPTAALVIQHMRAQQRDSITRSIVETCPKQGVNGLFTVNTGLRNIRGQETVILNQKIDKQEDR